MYSKNSPFTQLSESVTQPSPVYTAFPTAIDFRAPIATILAPNWKDRHSLSYNLVTIIAQLGQTPYRWKMWSPITKNMDRNAEISKVRRALSFAHTRNDSYIIFTINTSKPDFFSANPAWYALSLPHLNEWCDIIDSLCTIRRQKLE